MKKEIIFFLTCFTLFGQNDYNKNIERHYNLCPYQEYLIKKHFKLYEENAKKFNVYYFDTENLDNYQNGFILRVKTDNKKSSIRAKFRPFWEEFLPEYWLNNEDIFCEIDLYETSEVSSCHYTDKNKKNYFTSVLSGKKNIIEKISYEMFNFIESNLENIVFINKTKQYGPIKVFSWKINFIKNFKKLYLEKIVINNKKHLLELSYKSTFEEDYEINKKVLAFFKAHNIKQCNYFENKTIYILQNFNKD